MKFRIFIFFLPIFFFLSSFAQSFEKNQLQNPRVRDAKEAVGEKLRLEFEYQGLNINTFSGIYFRAFKQEQLFEVYVQGDYGEDYTLFKTYPFCEMSGYLGPKRKQGDRQIPEGFYFIEQFNPASNYHLSLGINYPNPSDAALSKYSRLGGDIFIHGACETIGCIPLTDIKIDEVYYLSVKAKSNGQTYIPVHIFPYKFDESSPKIIYQGRHDEKLKAFWRNLEEGYYYYEMHRRPPFVHINKNGYYDFF